MLADDHARNLPLIIGAAVVALAVLGLGIAAAFGVFNKKKDDAGTTTQQGGAEASDGGQATPDNPKAIVEAYLNALAKGDAKAARALVEENHVTDDSLLTDEVLQDSLKRAPLTDIQVTDPGEASQFANVKVSYKLGEETVNDELRVDATQGKISGLAVTELSLHSVKKIPIKVNGVEPKSDRPSVFPGSYEVVSANEYLEVSGQSTVLKKSSQDYLSSSMEVKISQAGIDMYREKVLPEAKACLASTQIDPGCDMALDTTVLLLSNKAVALSMVMPPGRAERRRASCCSIGSNNCHVHSNTVYRVECRSFSVLRE